MTTSDMQRKSPLFSDPTIIGLEKLSNTSWFRNTLNRTENFEDGLESGESMDTDHGEIDLSGLLASECHCGHL